METAIILHDPTNTRCGGLEVVTVSELWVSVLNLESVKKSQDIIFVPEPLQWRAIEVAV